MCSSSLKNAEGNNRPFWNTKENMLRLVRLAMPNIIRNKIFTEFALETMKDSIKYIRPFYSKTANGNPLFDRAADWDGYNDRNPDGSPRDYDPWGYSMGGEFNGDDFRKALYEDTRDRHNSELANGVITSPRGEFRNVPLAGGNDNNEVAVLFKQVSVADSGGVLSDASAFQTQKWGENGVLYIDGYVHLYGYNPGDHSEMVEQQAIAETNGSLAA